MKTDFEKFLLSEHPYLRSVYDDYKKTIDYINPNILIEKENVNFSQLDSFSALMKDRIIWMNTDVNEDSSCIAISQMIYLDSVNNDDITIYCCSGGGSVYHGLGVIDTMDFIDSDVSTVCIGYAASMMAVILSNGTKGKRFMLKNSVAMLHQPLSGIAAHTQASDIEIENNEVQRIKKQLYNILSGNMNQPVEKIIEICDRNFWVSPEKAIELGLVDDILIKKNKRG